MRLWPLRRRDEPSALVSISDPAAAALFMPPANFSGVVVSERTMMGLSGFYRAVSLLSGTLGQLPLKTYVTAADGSRERGTSVFDSPGGTPGPGVQTPFEWKRTCITHLKIHGNIYLLKVRNGGGAVARYEPIHPICVTPSEKHPTDDAAGAPLGGLWFTIALEGGDRVTYDANDVLHVPGLSLDGRVGLSLAAVAGNSLGTAVAGDRAAARIFNTGATISGIVSPESDVDGFDAKGIKRELTNEATGYDNAGGIAVINRVLKFTPWTMTMQDAQFLQSRQFSIEEIARWTGVPPHLLMQTEKQTSWGTGVEEQNRALGRTVLGPDAALLEQRFSQELQPTGRFVEFDFAGLERPSPDREIELLIEQWNADLLTLNEVREIRNQPPIPGGDVVKSRWEAANASAA